MATTRDLVNAIIQMEGSTKPGSVGYTMQTKLGLWNVGHLVWAGQQGAVPVELNGRKWAGWPTYDAAVAGLERQILLDSGRGLTLSQFINKYAPSHENDTSAYLRYVASQLGVQPTTPLSSITGSGPINPTAPPPSQPGERAGATGSTGSTPGGKTSRGTPRGVNPVLASLRKLSRRWPGRASS